MISKITPLLFAVAVSAAPLFATTASAEEPPVTCPSKACTCKTVKVYSCKARSNGQLYDCHDVSEMQCTITSGPGSGKDVKVQK